MKAFMNIISKVPSQLVSHSISGGHAAKFLLFCLDRSCYHDYITHTRTPGGPDADIDQYRQECDVQCRRCRSATRFQIHRSTRRPAHRIPAHRARMHAGRHATFFPPSSTIQSQGCWRQGPYKRVSNWARNGPPTQDTSGVLGEAAVGAVVATVNTNI